MTSQEQNLLRENYHRLVLDVGFSENEEVLNMYASFLLDIIHHQAQIPISSYSDGDSRMIAQMMLTKILHLRDMLRGVNFEEYGYVRLDTIVDPGVVAAIVRNIYETAATFNLIFRSPNSADARLINYNLWVIAGLKYRQNLAPKVVTPENIQKAADELIDISALTDRIKTTALFQGLSAEDQKLILEKIKRKDYRVVFESGRPVSKDWAGLGEVMGLDEGIFGGMYTYLSLYAHPSRVSVSQFGDMFAGPEEAFLSLTHFNLSYGRGIISVFIADFIHVFSSVLPVFERLPNINQIVINSLNKMWRGDPYSINKAFEMLG